MKTKILTIALALFLGLSFAACSNEKDNQPVAPTDQTETNGEAATSLDTAKISETIKDNVTMVDGLVLIETERNAENAYPEVLDMVEEYTIYINATGGYAEEIAVFKVKDGVVPADLVAKMHERIDYQKSVFEDYQPREMPKLEDPVIYSTDNLVIMVVADDSTEVTAAIEKSLA